MSEIVRTPDGGTLVVYDEVDIQRYGKDASYYVEAPDFVVQKMGWTAPRWTRNDPFNGGLKVWENEYGAAAGQGAPVPPGFYEIFTASRGLLTHEEVRRAEELAKLPIDDSSAVRAYNNKLRKDQSLFVRELSWADLEDWLEAEDFARLRKVHAWVALMIGAEPVYFEWKTDTPTGELGVSIIEGVRYVDKVETAKLATIAAAFPGPNCLVRDTFDLTQYLGGGPNPDAAGRRAMQLPGRDRWARLDGAGTFTTYLVNPTEVLSRIQMRQIEDGRGVTMERSPIVPPEMWGWLPA